MKTLKFRPTDGYPLSLRRKMGFPTGDYKWHYRHWYPSFIDRTGARLHYLADHAPRPIQRKWKRVFAQFTRAHPKF